MEGLEKMINVTIKSRKDTLSNWQTSNPVLSDGEVAVVEIPATDSTPAICLIKIGDGRTNFNTLQYMQSPAADVYAWAKKATKPEYDYSEIKNLTTMIVAGNNITTTTNDNKVTIATTQNVAKVPGTLPDIGDIEALPVWNSDEGWKRIDADALKATANTIVKRNASGQIVAAAPTANTHVTNKKYVDDAVSAKQDTISAGTGITINDNTVAVDSKIVPVAPAGGMGYASPGVVVNTAASQMVEPNWQTVGVGYSSLSGNIAKYNGSNTAGDGLGGTLPVSTPLEDNHAANKKYVDDAVGEKQDTLTAGEGISLAYNVVKISDNVSRTSLTDMGTWVPVQYRPAAEPYWEDMLVSVSADANSIAQRSEQGQILTAAPTQDGMAANKKYVDDAVSAKQDKLTAGTGITLTNNTVAIANPVNIVPKTDTVQLEITPTATQNISWESIAGQGTQVATINVVKTSDGKLQVNITGSYYTSLDDGINEDFIIGTIPVVAGKTYTLPEIDTAALDEDDNRGGYKWETANPFVATTTGTQNLIMHVHFAANEIEKEVSGMKPIASAVSYTLADRGLLQKTDDGYVFAEAGNGIAIGDGDVSVDEHVAYLPNIENTGIRTAIRENGQWKSAAVSTTADNYSIARRGAGGTLIVATPTSTTHAATKKYVDDAIAGVGGGSSADIWVADQDNSTKNYTIDTTKAQVYTFAGQSMRVYSDPSITISYNTNNTTTPTTVNILSLTSTTDNKVSARGTICTNPSGIYYDVWDGTGWKTGYSNNSGGTLTFTFTATGPVGYAPQAYVMVHTAP